jgi:hypothetical protein
MTRSIIRGRSEDSASERTSCRLSTKRMTEIPKIVRNRLGRTPGGASGVDHPDANLLTGYVERSLTSRERSLVLGHLAQCAECREQVSVALPKLEGQLAPRGAGVARGWLRWPVLRWGLLVASLVIMGTVALVRQPPARRTELASRANVATSSEASLPSDVTVGAAPSKAMKSPSSQETALPQGKSQTLNLNRPPEKMALNRKQAAQAQLKQEVQSYETSLGSGAPIAPSAPARALNFTPNAINGGNPNLPSTAVAQAPPPPAASALVAPTGGQPTQQALDLAPSPQPKQAETSRAPEEDKGMSTGEAAGGAVPAPPAAQAPRRLAASLAATPNLRQSTPAKSAPAPAVSRTASSALVSNLMTADWSITPSGKVQRSQDGRKTWEELDVDKNVVFRVVFAVGADVWLGGSKGALYHSTDGGQHWTRVTIATGSTTVADDVIHIEFKDAQHGTVGTAAGDSWRTLDAGQHWQKQ